MQSLASFRNRHEGETVLVCGCGESLNELEHPERFLTIGVNDVGRRFQPDYLVVVNPRSQFKGDRFRYVETSQAKFIFTQLELGLGLSQIVKFRLGQYGGTDFSDPESLPYTRNSPYVAVCVAVQMGARRIGLLGVDFTDNHFFANTGRHPLAGSLQQINEEYKKLGAALASRGIELVNLSHQSRLTGLRRVSIVEFAGDSGHMPVLRDERVLRPMVSYATTPVAGVPAILARCIAARTPHACRCVWATRSYDNGVAFEGDLEWGAHPLEAEAELEAADVVIVHNGKVDPRHERILATKCVVTLAHNYMWNVDRRFERLGMPRLVVGQYQATLPEFAGWTLVPNPIPIWEAPYSPADKPDVVTICYTPSGRHERYPAGHRLYWHGKGYETTMRVLDRLAATLPVRLEVVRGGQVAHVEALAMKRRAHIVIDECVTGSYHRNSLEGLATGCVVVNGVGLLPDVVRALRRCAPGAARVPFVFSNLENLEDVLRRLVEQGADALAAEGRRNRQWMERHWAFAEQWERFWASAVEQQGAAYCRVVSCAASIPEMRSPEREVATHTARMNAVSVVVPHTGAERLPLLLATLVTLRQRRGVGEVIVVELGEAPLAKELARRWADKHLFVKHAGAFERARSLNAGSAVAESELVLWHDNDLLLTAEFITRCTKELRDRGLDYLIPYTSIRYLSESDSLAVLRGTRSPGDCRPVTTMHSTPRGLSCSGGIGLVRRDFLVRHGGHIEGFRGWGGEDNAWIRKVTLLGRSSSTTRRDQHVYHLYHPSSGGYVQMAASHLNPHYAENVELLGRVAAVRQPAQLAQQFPASVPAAGTLTRSPCEILVRPSDELAVWTYWEGPCPAWIRACRRTVLAHAPWARLLTPEEFDRLWDRDRDIDLTQLRPAHRADYIRAFLLRRYGGLWIDTDCLVIQSLRPLLDLLANHDFIGHRERSGLVSNGFIGARPGSSIASSFYTRVRETLRAGQPLGWTSIGSAPLNAILNDGHRWHELPCESVQPVCWSQPEAFFVQRSPDGHERVFDPRAICYMLSNVAINRYSTAHDHPDLLDGRTFFSFLLRRALGGPDGDPLVRHEDIFSGHVELYRTHGYESLSGPGSSLAATQELRERLPLVLEDLGVRTLLDAPCGDLNWIRHVWLALDDYIGVDLLAEHVANNEWRNRSPRRRFLRADLIRDPLPQRDAILCRDLLPHLTFDEIARALANFKQSGATYLLTTTFTGVRPNHETAGGNWRTLNLNLPPFSFPPPLCIINEKCTENGGAFADKSIGVWRLADLPIASGTRVSAGEASAAREVLL